MTTAAARRPFWGWILFIAAMALLIFIMVPKTVPMDTGDKAKFPWLMRRLVAGGTLGGPIEGYYPSWRICEEARLRKSSPGLYKCEKR